MLPPLGWAAIGGRVETLLSNGHLGGSFVPPALASPDGESAGGPRFCGGTGGRMGINA